MSTDQLEQMFARQRSAFVADGFPDAAIRRERIDRLEAMLLDGRERLCDALALDYGTRPQALSLVADVISGLNEMAYMQKNLERWMRPERPKPLARLAGVTMEAHPVPLGVVGIIGPWNFPLQLVAQPAAAALAAGNRVMLRPSSTTPRMTQVLAELAPRFFSADELVVVTKEIASGAEFAALPFDHLFFTGSTATGKQIQRAAAENLTPVTLELGGKNPAVVAPTADIDRAATRIGAARMVNSGQTCLSPDLAFVPVGHVESFVDALIGSWRDRYPQVADNDQYVSIIDEQQYRRVLDVLDDAAAKGATIRSAAPDGELLPAAASRKIAPTVVTGVTDAMRIADEEIFGPVLAVHSYEDIAEVIDYLGGRPSPLSSYWYGDDDHDFRRFFRSTRSGSVNRNDFGLVNAMHHLPFGGVGRSGMGSYHGKFGFDTFSHLRPIAAHGFPFSLASIIATPYSPTMTKAIVRYAEQQRKAVTKRLARHR
ncbi:aldehyde dehydrogenase family protein [Corynebacteriales bacterium D3-21]|uniref:Aldehyde dehydrogenase n=2 Tax=Speluncibacter jeojiensis TaxID=2710754 RepID=A0A9X4M1J2_9ACTN|nr:aldehyde dehydrogenase family protein [Corynebacteriales bacterium D3-21]